MSLNASIKSVISQIDKRGDISRETLDYLINNPKFGRFYLLPHKRLHSVPGRPVISNSSFYTENISTFLDFHLKPLSKQVKSFVKDTNDFLKKLFVIYLMIFCCVQWTWLVFIRAFHIRMDLKRFTLLWMGGKINLYRHKVF